MVLRWFGSHGVLLFVNEEALALFQESFDCELVDQADRDVHGVGDVPLVLDVFYLDDALFVLAKDGFTARNFLDYRRLFDYRPQQDLVECAFTLFLNVAAL